MRNIPRTAPVGVRVMAYRNLHKACWSLKDPRSGRVVAHLDEVTLSDATFRVSQAGRERVIRERSKNVHAGVVGTVISSPDAEIVASMRRVRYNPYQTATFVVAEGGAPVLKAPLVHLSAPGGAFALLEEEHGE